MESSATSSSSKGRSNPFVGPRPIETGEKIYGREFETLTLLNLLIAERIVLFHSPSGAGKTSLIQASLIPQLQTRHFRVLPIVRIHLLPSPDTIQTAQAKGNVLNRYVYSTISSLVKAVPEKDRPAEADLASLKLPEYLVRFPVGELQPESKSPLAPPTHAPAPGISPLFIFDQFEQVLTLDPVDQSAKQTFFEQLGQVLADTGCWALFVIREDYLAGLDPYVLYVPTRFKTTFRLDLLNTRAARQAIQKTADDGGVEFSDPAVDKLIDDLRLVKVQQLDGTLIEKPGPYIEPVQLQVVCRRLWDGLPSGLTKITETEVVSIGNVDQSLAAYYADQVASVSIQSKAPERLVRDWFQHKLITEQGGRGAVLKGVDTSEGLDNQAILLLENAHLVRAEQRAGTTWFELAHDRLVAPIRQENEIWFRDHLSDLQRQAGVWEREKRPDRLLLREQTLKKAQEWASAHDSELTPYEREFLQNSLDTQAQAEQQRQLQADRQLAEERALAERQRAEDREQAAVRLRQRLIMAIIAGAIALILFIVAAASAYSAIRQRQIAETAQKVAETAQAVAAANAGEAIEESNRANVAQANAEIAEATAIGAAKTAQADRDLKTTAESVARSLASTAVAEATAQVPLAGSRLLAAQALSYLETKPDISALLGIEAYRIQPTWEALNLLLTRILREPGLIVRGYGGSLPDQPSSANAVALSPDGKLLAWGRGDGAVLVREISTGVTRSRTLHTQKVSSVAFSPDGATLASSGYDKHIFLWDVAHLADKAYRPVELKGDPDTLVLSLAFNPDGDRLAAGVGEFIEVFNLDTHEQIVRMQHSDYVYSLAWSPIGNWLAAGDVDSNLIVWDPSNGQRFNTPGGVLPKGGVYSLAWSPDSRLLAVGDGIGKVILYDIQRGESIGQPFQDHTRTVLGMDFSQDGRLLATGGADNKIFFYDVPTLSKAGEYDLGYRINSVSFTDTPGQNLLAVGGYDFSRGRLNLLEALPANPLYTVQESGAGSVLALGIDPLGKPLSARSSDLDKMAGTGAHVTSAAFGSDGRNTLIAVGDEKGQIQLQDWISHKLILRFDLPQRVEALAISPGGGYLAASYCEESAVEVRPVCTKNTIRLWDLSTRQPLEAILSDNRHDWIRSLAFHPDGVRLVSGSYDGSLLVWDFLKGKLVAEPKNRYPGGITSLAFSPDGRLLVSGGTSSKLVLWDAANNQPIGPPLDSVAGQITSLAFALSRNELYSGFDNGSLLRWDVDAESWIERNCALAGRNLTPAELQQYLPGAGPNHKTCP